jgi:uncharacterized membrane protein
MWIQYALFSSFLWAIVHILDEHCVDKIFSKPWLGVITSSGVSAGIFLLLPVFHPKVTIPNWDILLICLLTGSIIQLSQLFYFRALDSSDSGTVSAYWNLTPIFLLIISYWLFGSLVTGGNYIGIALLVIASVGLCSIDRFSGRWNTLYLMSIAAGFQTLVILLEKYIFERTDFFGAFLSIAVGVVVSGLSILANKEIRLTFIKDSPQIKQALPILMAIELVNWGALYCGQTAIKLGIPTLVAAIEASTPAYAFGLALLIARLQRRKVDRDAQRKLPIKWGLIGLMMTGVWLIGAST